ncbi:MAG: hypothetical protein ABID63_12070 [Pseudomonadota bacterium]
MVCVSLLAVSACAMDGAAKMLPDRKSPELVLPDRPRLIGDWSDALPALYGPVVACLNAHPAPPAHAASVARDGEVALIIDMVGQNNSFIRCRIDLAGHREPVMVPLAAPPERIGPFFTANPYAPPKSPVAPGCYLHFPVVDTTGWQLGWLTYGAQDRACRTPS